MQRNKVTMYRPHDGKKIPIAIPAQNDEDDIDRKHAMERVSGLQAKGYIVSVILFDSHSGDEVPVSVEPQVQNGQGDARLLAFTRTDKAFFGKPRYYTEEAWAKISVDEKKSMLVDSAVKRVHSAAPQSVGQKADAALMLATQAARNTEQANRIADLERQLADGKAPAAGKKL